MKRIFINFATAVAFVTFGSWADAQQYDYLAKRGNLAGLTAQQITDSLNATAAAGWEAFFAVPEIHTGDVISIYRRPHTKCAAGQTSC